MNPQQTLLLTHWYFPHKIVSWQDAVTLHFLGKADVVVEYDDEISSPSTTIKMPAVMRLKKKLSRTKRGVKFSRINVYTRDRFTCGYCNTQFPARQLTYDHVTPRARGGRTTWENIVTSCYACNSKKANRTPAEAKMRLSHQPYRPKTLPLTPPPMDMNRVPPEWRDFCQMAVQV